MIGVFSNTLSFNISSTTFDQRIDTGGYREFILENTGTEAIRYKFEIKKGDTDKDMSKWVTIYPKVMNIPPLEKRVLKVYAQSPSGAEQGEYDFNLAVNPIVVPTIKESDGKIITGNSTIGFAPLIQMKGYVGDANFEENIELTNHLFDKNKDGRIEYSATIENKSFAGLHVGLKFKTWNGNIIDGKWLGRLGKGKKESFSYVLNEKVKKIDEIKEIVIYDATSLRELKTVKL